MRRYLLGDLPEEEQQRVDWQSTGDSGLSEALQEAENDLIDAYVCQELSQGERRRFETYFLDSFDKLRRVEIAQMLMNSVMRANVPHIPEPVPNSFLWKDLFSGRVALAAAAVGLFVIAGAVMIQNRQLKGELIQAQAREQDLQNTVNGLRQVTVQPAVEAKAAIPAPAKQSQPAPSVASLMLVPGSLRSGGGQRDNTLRLTAQFSAAILMLSLDDTAFSNSDAAHVQYLSFEAVLENTAGRKLQKLTGLHLTKSGDGSPVVSARFSSGDLSEGDYIVTLLGSNPGSEPQELAAYSLSVRR